MKLKEGTDIKAVTKLLVHLLWQAVGGTSGMGFLQDRGPDVTIDQLWKHVVGNGDYNFSGKPLEDRPMEDVGEVYMDYVMGRCMKTRVRWNVQAGTIEVTPNEPRPTYQCWDRKYKTGEAALREAVEMYSEALP